MSTPGALDALGALPSLLYVADLEARPPRDPLAGWRPRPSTRSSLDALLAEAQPRIEVEPQDGERLTLSFASLADFAPDAVALRDPGASHLASGDLRREERLRRIFSAPSFRALEEAWLGLAELVRRLEGRANVDAMGIQWVDLAEEVEEAPSPAHTDLHDVLHTRQYIDGCEPTSGRLRRAREHPYAATLVALPITSSPRVLASMATSAAHAHTLLVLDGRGPRATPERADALVFARGTVLRPAHPFELTAPEGPGVAAMGIAIVDGGVALAGTATVAGAHLATKRATDWLARNLSLLDRRARDRPLAARVEEMRAWLDGLEIVRDPRIEVEPGPHRWSRPRVTLRGVLQPPLVLVTKPFTLSFLLPGPY